MRVLILGGSGFVGSAVAKLLSDRCNSVTALARDVSQPKRRMPQIDWISTDIAKLLTPEAWLPLLKDIDAVVNCAGALQDSARDNVAAVQYDAMRALYEAAARLNIKLIVQISARAYGNAADLPFLSTKQAADKALKACGAPFVVLKPAVIIGRTAYGGSALLRALAAFPLVTPLVHADAQMQFAALDDVTAAVADAVEGRIEPGSDLDLAAPEHFLFPKLSPSIAGGWDCLPHPSSPYPRLPPAPSLQSPTCLAGWAGDHPCARRRSTWPPPAFRDIQPCPTGN